MTGRALGSRQFHVGPLASADCSAGIPDGDALYLVRSRFQSLRGGVNDVGFHPLPIGDAARFLNPNPPMDPDGGREDSGRGGRELQAR